MRRGLQDEEGKFHNRYTMCLGTLSKPHGFIRIDSVLFTSGNNTVGTQNLKTVLGIRTKKKLKFSDGKKFHFEYYLNLLE